MTEPTALAGLRPEDALHEIYRAGTLDDDARQWVPVGDGLWSRPLCLNISEGYWTHLFRVRRAGMVNRHRHPGPVILYTLRGRWRYLERDWIAEPGSFIFEPPGDTHTLVVPEDVDDMIFLSTVKGALIYVDEAGEMTGYDDVFTRLAAVRTHFVASGLGEEAVRALIR